MKGAGEVPADQAGERVADVAPVGAKLLHGRLGEGGRWAQQCVDDEGQDGDAGAAQDVGESSVERRAFRRCERPPEGRLAEGCQGARAPGSDLCPPGLVAETGRARAFVEGLRRAPEPTASRTAWPPTARATVDHSPLGSPGTYTLRPKAM